MISINANPWASNLSTGVTSTVGTVVVDSTDAITLSGTLSDGAAGKLALTQSGSGTTILTGTNTYSGATTIPDGTLQVGNATAGSIGGSSAISVSGGGILSLVNVNGGTFTNGVSNNVGGIGTVSIDSTGTTTLSGALTDGSSAHLALSQIGSGTTILTNNASNYSGATTISNGTLQIGNSTSAGSIGQSSAVSFNSGATFAIVNV